MMIASVAPRHVRLALLARREIALVDLREEAPFATGHPLFACQIPLSRLELEVFDRIPRRDVPIVLYDDGDDLVERGAGVLASLGYTNVRALEGGLKGWRDAGYEIFEDVNSYCKAFGELVEAQRHTPSVSAEQLQAQLDAKDDVVILDARRFEEYRVMSIPTAISVPGAELLLRARDLAPDPKTKIVVNCAGRTRSLIGAQSLINAGIPNPVAALCNGTIGWTLADQPLEHGQSRRCSENSGQSLDAAKSDARDIAYRAGVRRISDADLEDLARDASRTLYRFDVRQPDKYDAGRLTGFRNAPGGQLVQETDMFAPVRGARIVLWDDLGPRADMSASWLAQMGWEVFVLEPDAHASLESGAWSPSLPGLPSVGLITPAALIELQACEDVAVIDLAKSVRYIRRGHIPGAHFAIRAQLKEALAKLPQSQRVVFTSPDGNLARLAAAEFPYTLALNGGTAAWIAQGHPVEKGRISALSEPTDIYKRPYEGVDNAKPAMQAYLDWQIGLVEQLEKDGTHGFFVI